MTAFGETERTGNQIVTSFMIFCQQSPFETPRKASVRIVGVSVEIRTENLPNTHQKPFGLLGFCLGGWKKAINLNNI
jgi:hypothetical protein